MVACTQVFVKVFSFGGPLGGVGVVPGMYKESSVFALLRGVGQVSAILYTIL